MNKFETKQLKGLALILMFWHHLFCFSREQNWLPLIPGIETTGASAKICVALFLFCTGYGLYSSYISKKTVKPFNNTLRILKFLITYWTMLFLVAVPYLAINGKFDPQYIFVSMFALIHSDKMLYLSFSWYVKLHFVILLLLPIIRFLENEMNVILKKYKSAKISLELTLHIIVPIAISIILETYFNDEGVYYGFPQFVLSSLSMITRYYPIFYIGVLFNKYSIMNKSRKLIEEHTNKVLAVFVSIALLITILMVRSSEKLICGEHFDLLLTPITAIAFLTILKILNLKYLNKLFEFIGEYSFQYWLLSGMFFLNTMELQWIVYMPKYPILILVWKLIILTIPAVIFHFISNFINGNIQKLFDTIISKSKSELKADKT